MGVEEGKEMKELTPDPDSPNAEFGCWLDAANLQLDTRTTEETREEGQVRTTRIEEVQGTRPRATGVQAARDAKVPSFEGEERLRKREGWGKQGEEHGFGLATSRRS